MAHLFAKYYNRPLFYWTKKIADPVNKHNETVNVLPPMGTDEYDVFLNLNKEQLTGLIVTCIYIYIYIYTYRYICHSVPLYSCVSHTM